jgi:leucyl aminopeptidase
MPRPVEIAFQPLNEAGLAAAKGRLVLLCDGKLTGLARKVDKLTRGALARAVASAAFTALKPGESLDLAFPAGLAAEAVQIISLPRRTDMLTARKAGGAIGRALASEATLVVAEHPRAADIAFGLAMRPKPLALSP